jgi:bacteriocin biosynthesis cyclodehydratase domain-containing protein
MPERLRVPAYLSVVSVGSEVLVGLLPPRAVRISEPPEYLPALLGFLSVPRTRDEVATYAARAGGLTADETRTMLEELVEAGVLSTRDVPADGRYDRHLLYYDLLGLDPANAQLRLGEAVVGLVGMGGIGASVATVLAAAGIGTLVCSDGDVVEASNLTRQTLYDHTSIGSPKVDIAAAKLRALNPDVTVVPVRESIAGEDLFDRHFANCRMVVLSADSPPDVHAWTNDAALRFGFATSNAGYIEAFGVVGPLVVPGRTPCYECFRGTGDLQTPGGAAPENLNAAHQAPSFGPLNATVAALQANEVIRHLLGLEVETEGCRLLIDSTTYEVHRERFRLDPSCARCAHLQSPPANAPAGDMSLAELYARDRESASQNAIVLDDLVGALVPGAAGRRVLDLGCGTGQQAIRLAQAGCDVVATDVSADMLREAAAAAERAGVGDRVRFSNDDPSELDGPFDDILCLNVLDHVEDPLPLLRSLARLLGPRGSMLVSLPHPIKDRGYWYKEHVAGRWRYPEFVLDGYFEEGPVTKSREDALGNVVIESISTFHRTTATWVRLFVEAGLSLRGLWEPAPSPDHATTHPILYEKSSRIPYFVLFALEFDSRGGLT